MSVANQKIIKLAPRIKRDSKHLYCMANLEALQAAMSILNGSGLKLWLYLNKNQDGYRFELSRVDCANWGIKKDSYYSAVDELVNKGFLVQDHCGSNMFWFHEKAVSVKPKSFSESPTTCSEKPQVKSENTERNNTDNTEIIKNTTMDDDNAVGVIVDCGVAAIPRSDVWNEEKRIELFGTFKNEKVYENEDYFIGKHFC